MGFIFIICFGVIPIRF